MKKTKINNDSLMITEETSNVLTRENIIGNKKKFQSRVDECDEMLEILDKE